MSGAAEIAHPCPLCGAGRDRELYRHRGRIVRCLGCGLVRRDPIPPAVSLLHVYRSADYFRLRTAGPIGYGDYYADAPVYRPYFRRKLRLLSRYAAPPGDLLEVGAAAGYALEAARDLGWRARGLELSPDAVTFARERLGVDAAVGGIDDLEDESRWDVVAAFQTIEHLPDVRAALRRARRALRPGGVLALTTPDHGSFVRRAMRRFWISYRPEHLLYFDRRRLARLLSEEGFRVELVSGDDPLLVPLARVVERAAHYYAGKRLDARLMSWARVPLWLGDLQAIARRT